MAVRLIGAVSIVFTLTLTLASGFNLNPSAPADQSADQSVDLSIDRSGSDRRGDRDDDDGDNDRRRLRIGKEIFRFDTFGDEQLWTDVLRMHEVVATISPATALQELGLKVDVEALPRSLIAALRADDVDLDDPAVTLALLRLNAVPVDSESEPVVIPPIYGLKGVFFETVTGDGPIPYWNAYVGIGQMGGQGTFIDPRIGLFIIQRPDLVTPKLPALLQYQLSLRTPDPPADSFDAAAARRGKRVFFGEAECASCHKPPNFTDVLSGPRWRLPILHDPAEVGTDSTYAERSATGKYRTTPLRALWQHAPYFHDGSAKDLMAVVDHYVQQFGLTLSDQQKDDLVEFLKSL